jgi:FixJ family two-component response regulator
MTQWDGPKLVLVVEDDDGMREAIDQLLSVAGFTTMLYGSAEAMLSDDAIQHPLCLVSDMHLPAMSGLDLVKELNRRGVQIPAIIVTAYESAAIRQEAARLGVSGFLVKPFPSAALLTTIKSIASHAGTH